MAAQRRIDLVLDSVKRLLRIGATANLLNLLQKQHPADLAPGLQRASRQGARGGVQRARRAQRPARDGGPQPSWAPRPAPQLLATGPAEEIARLVQEIPVRRRGGADRPPAGRAVGGGPRPDAAASESAASRNLLEYAGADRRPHHEPECLRAERGHDGGRGHHRAAERPRRRDGLLSLRRRRAAAPGRRRLAAPAAAGARPRRR